MLGKNDALKYYIKELQEQINEQIIVLNGNHDIKRGLIDCRDNNIISWLESLPMYYEADTQIFVHAGVDEEMRPDWHNTSQTNFCRKYPHLWVVFIKTIL